MAQALVVRDIRRRLRPMAFRLRLRDTLLLISQTLWLPLAIGALVQIVGRLAPIPNLLIWSLAPLAVWLAFVLGYLVLRPMPLQRVAQRVDTMLGLRERLSTALELSKHEPPHDLDDEQQRDAREHAATLRPRMLPWLVDKRRLALAVLPLAVLVASAMLPNPQNRVLREQTAVQQAVQQTIQQVQQAQQQIAQDKTLSPEERAALEQELAQLEQRLRDNSGNREPALADLSTTEARLQQRRDPNADAQRAAMEQLARNLQSLSGEQSTQRPSLEQAAEQLRQLAQQLDQMTPEQRQQTAQNLQQQAAQMAQSDTQAAQNLSNAAQAMQQGNTAQAQQALNQAANSVQQAQQQQANQQAVNRSIAQVQQSRQDIAQAGQQQQTAQQGQQGQGQQQGQQGQQAGQQQGQQGQQAGQQQGQQGQQGQQAQQNQQGQQGGQPGQGNGAQGGAGSNANNLGQAQGGHANVNQNQKTNGNGQGSGSDDLVYQPYNPSNKQGQSQFVPGQQNQGGQTQTQQGQTNMPGANNQSLVPYSQVLPQYQQSAGQALDQSAIPPHLKDYVRDYFSQLEPQR
jgi:hypothetical protein